LSARDLVLLDVVDRDSGQTLPEYRHRGEDWIAGVPGHRYSVRLTNTTGERVLVVLSVDGVNAVTGQTASPSQGGYVLEPWETAEIAGWRKSLDDIAQFVFTDLPDSYAARTGRPANVGVVGVAVFRERQVRPAYAPPPAPPIASGMARNESRKASVARRQRRPRDGVRSRGHAATSGHRPWPARMGAGRADRVRACEPQRPQQVSQLRYDDADALVALGILPHYRAPYAGNTPRAFPNGFVQDPPYRY
jgi:hypothetical protein